MEELKLANHNTTLVDSVEESLISYFKEQGLRPGCSIPNEMELAASLGVGRAVLREALSRFKMTGMIVSRTKKGMVLGEPSLLGGMKRCINPLLMNESTLCDILEFRVALEIGISDNIFRNLTDADVAELKEIVEMSQVIGNNKYAPVSEHRFHTKLYEITGNKIITEFQDIIYPVLDFVKGKPAEQAANEILTICEHYPAPAMDTALNFLSTHDTERALTVIADEPANGRGREWQSGRCVTGDAYEEGLLRLRMAYAIIYTLPGVPCLYYGDEIAMQGYRDPFNRAFFRWDAHEQRLRPVLAQLAQLRHTCEAFRTGKLNVLRAEGGILHYQRIGEAETAEIIVNRTEHIIVETLASGKSTEVNPMGFTIVVEEVGHNPNHSYYDYI